MRAPALAVLLVAACLLGTMWRAQAQTAPAIPAQPASRTAPVNAGAPGAPLAWSRLSPGQQRILAPLQGQWHVLGPARQHWLATHARQWATLSPQQQQQIRARLSRWTTMTPEQRRQLRENARAFHNLSPAERARVSEAFRKFQSLPPAEQRALRERWRAMPPAQRKRWVTEHPGKPIPARPPGHGDH